MSKMTEEQKKTLLKKLNKNGKLLNQYKSPPKSEKISSKINIINKNNINIISPGKNLNFLENNNNNNNYIPNSEDKDNKLFKGFLQKLNKIGEFGFNEKNTYMFPLSSKDINDITDNNNIYENNSINEKNNENNNPKEIKNLSMNMSANNILDIKNINLTSGNISPKKSNPLFNNNDQYDSKYSFKINKIKDDYINFLQKEFEDNTKKSAKLDSNNKELLKKCDDLLHDNKLLSTTLNDRTEKLNKIIQENLTVKSQLDKTLLINEKNEQKINFYEEQFRLYKASNENYQKVIQELKEQIEQLNNNLTEMQKANEDNLNEVEENYKNNLNLELEKNKKEIEDYYFNQSREENINIEQRFQEMGLHIKNIEEKNQELNNELIKKESINEILMKENEKLTGENSLYKSQVEQCNHQISELNNIIKHKDNIINNLKSENLNNEKLLNKNNSYSIIKLNETNEFFNENI